MRLIYVPQMVPGIQSAHYCSQTVSVMPHA